MKQANCFPEIGINYMVIDLYEKGKQPIYWVIGKEVFMAGQYRKDIADILLQNFGENEISKRIIN